MVPSPALGETSGMPQPEKAFQKNAQMSQSQELTAGPAGIVTRLLSVPIYKAAATGCWCALHLGVLSLTRHVGRSSLTSLHNGRGSGVHSKVTPHRSRCQERACRRASKSGIHDQVLAAAFPAQKPRETTSLHMQKNDTSMCFPPPGTGERLSSRA